MTKQIHISLTGCGWLGLPLAESLISRGYQLKGSTTSPNKLEILRKRGIDPYLVHFTTGKPESLDQFLETDILIIAVPPGRKNPDGNENYRHMINILMEKVAQSEVKRIILISSTSVYGDNNREVDESDLPNPDTDSGKLMARAEQQILQLKGIQSIVVRLGGLIGPGRNPGKFFAGRTNIPNGLAPVNMIHQKDAIGIIETLIEDRSSHGIYNACSPTHPSREEFYSLSARSAGLEIPHFIPERKNWKIVNSKRLTEELNYTFQIPDLLMWAGSDDH